MSYRRITLVSIFVFICAAAQGSARADNITYILTARQATLMKNMDRISDTVANANTTAYKAESDIMTEVKKRPSNRENLSFTTIGKTVRNTTQGNMVKTNRPLDVAISGPGYFMAITPYGPMYTRNGNFMVDKDGVLVTQDGYPLSGQSGGQVTFTDKDTDIEIKDDGQVKSGIEERGQIGVFIFENESLLKRVGGSLYQTSQSPLNPDKFTLVQGMLENSNVNSVTSMTDLVTVSRNFENITKMSAVHDQMQLEMIKKLTQ
jgi:flagellar basal-body rod protein FlgF